MKYNILHKYMQYHADKTSRISTLTSDVVRYVLDPLVVAKRVYDIGAPYKLTVDTSTKEVLYYAQVDDVLSVFTISGKLVCVYAAARPVTQIVVCDHMVVSCSYDSEQPEINCTIDKTRWWVQSFIACDIIHNAIVLPDGDNKKGVVVYKDKVLVCKIIGVPRIQLVHEWGDLLTFTCYNSIYTVNTESMTVYSIFQMSSHNFTVQAYQDVYIVTTYQAKNMHYVYIKDMQGILLSKYIHSSTEPIMVIGHDGLLYIPCGNKLAVYNYWASLP